MENQIILYIIYLKKSLEGAAIFAAEKKLNDETKKKLLTNCTWGEQ